MTAEVEGNGRRRWPSYGRAAGGIQLFFAAIFGWDAGIAVASFVLEMNLRRGSDAPPVDYLDLADGLAYGVLSLAAFVAGCGLLWLRPWARAWEVAYPIVAISYAAIVLLAEFVHGRDLRPTGLFAAAFILPFLPIVFPGTRSAYRSAGG